MKLIAYIITAFKSIPKIVELEMQNFEEHLSKLGTHTKRDFERREIINLIRTLNLEKEELRSALDKATEGNNKEVIRLLVQYIHKTDI